MLNIFIAQIAEENHVSAVKKKYKIVKVKCAIFC